MITSDVTQIQEMYDAQNMTRGIASRACMSQEQHKAAVKRQEALHRAAQLEKEPQPRLFQIPNQIYEEFTDVNIENEEFFKYMSYLVLMQFIQKTVDLMWVL